MSSRPLSPHLQIYRPQLTSVLSIMHRGTGIFLSIGSIALTYWLLSIAGGVESYEHARECIGSLAGQLFLLGWTFSFFYHLGAGIRHLFWDAGIGFELSSVYRSGYLVIAASLIMTALTWWCVIAQGGLS